MAEPIWKDYTINLGTSDAIDYTIRLNNASGELIYTGRAYKRPGATNNTIRINDVCADYIAHSLRYKSLDDLIAMTLPVPFYISTSSAHWSVIFYNDWSYDRSFSYGNGLNAPVRRVFVPGQIIYCNLGSGSTASYSYKTSAGATKTGSVSKLTAFEDNDFGKMLITSGVNGICQLNTESLTTPVQVTLNNVTYKAVECAKYILYYVNAYGGVDHLVIEGETLVSDSQTRSTSARDYDNTDVSNRERNNYVNEVSRSYQLRTGLMTDAESALMHHLVNSTDVFLYDIDAEQMIPVILTDTSCEYKTYNNQGGKMFNYTINVQQATDIIRR